MKKNKYFLQIVLSALIIMGLFYAGTLYHEGSPGGKTGSPGDNLADCSVCHVANGGYMSYVYSDIPESGYIANETYSIQAVAWLTGYGKFGFELTAEDENGNKVGQFIVSDDGKTQLTNDNTAITHTAIGTNSHFWISQWIAPKTDAGPITFYVASIAADGNGDISGDVLFLSSITVNESSNGLNDNMGNIFFTMSPNPTDGQLFIMHSYRALNIVITDLNGKLAFQQGNYMSGERINLSHLNKGIYLVQIQNDKKVSVQKLIIK